MKEAILLCGVGNAGKTNTLKKFYGRDISKKLRPFELLKRKFNGKTYFSISLASPQERSRIKGNGIDLAKVIKLLNEAIEKCNEVSNGTDYTLIMPFGLYGTNRGKLDEECIMKPIEILKAQGFKVNCIYLRKKTARKLSVLDSFMNSLTSNVIESTEDYCHQAKEFERIIRKL